jgi:hypothetical protein
VVYPIAHKILLLYKWVLDSIPNGRHCTPQRFMDTIEFLTFQKQLARTLRGNAWCAPLDAASIFVSPSFAKPRSHSRSSPMECNAPGRCTNRNRSSRFDSCSTTCFALNVRSYGRFDKWLMCAECGYRRFIGFTVETDAQPFPVSPLAVRDVLDGVASTCHRRGDYVGARRPLEDRLREVTLITSLSFSSRSQLPRGNIFQSSRNADTSNGSGSIDGLTQRHFFARFLLMVQMFPWALVLY